MSFLQNSVPESCRDAFKRDALSGVLSGVYTAFVGAFLIYVAKKELHSSSFLIGLIASAPFIGSVLALFYAHAMEGKRKMPFVVWPHSIGRGLFLLMIFINTPLPFALVATVSQLLVSIGGPPYAAVIKEIYPNHERGILMAYIRVLAIGAMFVFTLVAGKLLHALGYHYVFPIAAIVGIGSALAFGSIKTEPIDGDDQSNQRVPLRKFLPDTLAILKHDAANRWFAIAVAVGGFGTVILPPVFAEFQVDNLHMTESQLAIIVTAGTITWALTYPLWGRLIDSRNPTVAWVISMVVWAVYPMSYFFATKWWHVLIPYAFASASMGGMELGYFNGILHYAKEGKETQHQAVHSFVQGVRGIIGPFTGAWLLAVCEHTGMQKRYLFVLSLAFIITGCVIMTRKTRDERHGVRSTAGVLAETDVSSEPFSDLR